MPELTYNERLVLDVLRRCRGTPMRARDIHESVRVTHGIYYDSVVRAMSGLVRKGFAVKPRRGWYLSDTEGGSDGE